MEIINLMGGGRWCTRMVIGMMALGVRVARYTERLAKVKAATVTDLGERNRRRGEREMITPLVEKKKDPLAEE
jgi:hypothetical protein